MAVPWQGAEPAPSPRLLALNGAARARARPRPRRRWQTPDGGCACSSATWCPRARPGGAGLAGHQLATTSRGWARAGDPARRAGPRPAAGWATCNSRARAARRSRAAVTASPPSGRCSASTSSAKRCTPSASRRPRVGRRRDGRAGAPRDRPPGGGAHPGRGQPPARRLVRVRRGTGDDGLLTGWPPTPSPAITRRQPTRPCAPGAVEAVIAARAALVAQWMLVGFIHGVMNTDNMTISGETSTTARARSSTLRPGDGVQLDRPGRPLRLGNQPSSRSGTSPGSPRRCCRSGRRRGEAVELAEEVAQRVPRRTPPRGTPACARSSACASDGREGPRSSTTWFDAARGGHVDVTSFFRALGPLLAATRAGTQAVPRPGGIRRVGG